jgi:glycosyltransferase involved in cell wall biosynthesis
VTTQIVNVSELTPSWNWLANRFPGDQLRWAHCSSHVAGGAASRLGMPLRRVTTALAARHLVRSHRSGRSIIVSHGPRPALYVELLARAPRDRVPHLVFSFNFTDLPTGARRTLMRRHLGRVDRFVVASSVERAVYSDYFQIEANRIDVLLWSIQPPLEELAKPARFGAGPYICAIGSQARDYATLIEAMRRVPAIKLVLVASPDSLPQGPLPANVEILTSVPMSDAMNVLAHSQFMVLPLRDSRVPCGHVTVVSAMHMGKAILATNSSGLHDYLIKDENAEFCAPRSPAELAAHIERLSSQPAVLQRMGAAGLAFARENCSEDGAVRYFRRFLHDHGVSE